MERIKDMDNLHSQQRSVGWGLGATQQDQMSKHATSQALIRLYQLLLFTMPGTPVFTYGDEIGLQAQVSNKTHQVFKCFNNLTAAAGCNLASLFPHQGEKFPDMVWDIEKEPAEGAVVNNTVEVKSVFALKASLDMLNVKNIDLLCVCKKTTTINSSILPFTG